MEFYECESSDLATFRSLSFSIWLLPTSITLLFPVNQYILHCALVNLFLLNYFYHLNFMIDLSNGEILQSNYFGYQNQF